MVSLLLSPYSQIPLLEQRVLDKQIDLAMCNDCVGRDEDLLMERHAQYINRGELAGRRRSWLGHQSAGGEQLHCASLVFFLFFPLFFFFLLYSFSLLLLLYFIITIVSIIFYFSY